MVLRLITKLVLFVSIISTLMYAMLYLNVNYSNEYIGGIREKLNKIKSIEGKKIVIVGGSNASFGIDTRIMEKDLNIEVVNLALHGSLPVKYMIEQVNPYLRKGDILIMSREPGGLAGDHRWNHMVGTELPLMPSYNFSELQIPLSDQNLFETTATSFFSTLKLYVRWYPFKKRTTINSVYDSRVFEGDNIADQYLVGLYTDSLKIRPPKKPSKNSLLVKGLREFKTELDKREILFYMTPAVVTEGYFTKDELMPFWHYVSEQTSIPLLNDNKDYVFEKRYFLNSPHHPNLDGRVMRTKSLINDILNNSVVNSAINNFQNKKIEVGL